MELLKEAPVGSYVLPAIVVVAWLLSWRLSRFARLALLPIAFGLAMAALALGLVLMPMGADPPGCNEYDTWCHMGGVPDLAWIMLFSAGLEFLTACALVVLTLVGEVAVGMVRARRQHGQGV